MEAPFATVQPAVSPQAEILIGQMGMALIAAALLCAPVSWLLLRLYRRALLRGMTSVRGASPERVQVPAQEPAAAPAPAPLVIETVDLQGLFDRGPQRTPGSIAAADALRDLRRSGVAYVLGGCAYAVIETVCFVAAASDRFVTPGTIAVLWTFAWPAVLAINLTATVRRRERWFLIGVYLTVEALFVLVTALLPGGISPLDVVILWLIMNLPTTLLFGAVLARWVRAVGPLVLTFLFLALAGASGINVGIIQSDAVLRATLTPFLALGLPPVWAYAALMVTCLVVFGTAGLGVLLWLGRRYERKRTSDQSLTVDALFLLFASMQALLLMVLGTGWIVAGVAAFAAYKVVTATAFRRSAVRPVAPARQLLLLRVFALGSRGQQLFDVLTKLWLRGGPIALIAGPDLATSTVEPHEFLGFVARRMTRRFVRDGADLRERLATLDQSPDPDGRYRVNELFCHQDTWRDAVTALVADSDAILMDLRGFSPPNQGCVWELGQLLDVAPLDRCVLLIDATTDEAFLRRTLEDEWRNVSPASPNRDDATPAVRLARAGAVLSHDVREVVRSLSTA